MADRRRPGARLRPTATPAGTAARAQRRADMEALLDTMRSHGAPADTHTLAALAEHSSPRTGRLLKGLRRECRVRWAAEDDGGPGWAIRDAAPRS